MAIFILITLIGVLFRPWDSFSFLYLPQHLRAGLFKFRCFGAGVCWRDHVGRITTNLRTNVVQPIQHQRFTTTRFYPAAPAMCRFCTEPLQRRHLISPARKCWDDPNHSASPARDGTNFNNETCIATRHIFPADRSSGTLRRSRYCRVRRGDWPRLSH